MFFDYKFYVRVKYFLNRIYFIGNNNLTEICVSTYYYLFVTKQTFVEHYFLTRFVFGCYLGNCEILDF